MFASDNKKLKEISTTNVSTIIGDGTVIEGDVIFAGGLHIDGKVVGNVSATSEEMATLTLSKMGAIHGNVNVPIVAKIYLTDKFNLQAGPQFGVLVNDEAQTVIGEVINDIGTNEFDISGVVGIGFDVPLGLRLEGRYNFGLTDVPEERGADFNKSKNSVFTLSLGYSFL